MVVACCQGVLLSCILPLLVDEANAWLSDDTLTDTRESLKEGPSKDTLGSIAIICCQGGVLHE